MGMQTLASPLPLFDSPHAPRRCCTCSSMWCAMPGLLVPLSKIAGGAPSLSSGLVGPGRPLWHLGSLNTSSEFVDLVPEGHLTIACWLGAGETCMLHAPMALREERTGGESLQTLIDEHSLTHSVSNKPGGRPAHVPRPSAEAVQLAPLSTARQPSAASRPSEAPRSLMSVVSVPCGIAFVRAGAMNEATPLPQGE